MSPEGTEFIEEILDRHQIPDDEVETSTEWIANEYSIQDGA